VTSPAPAVAELIPGLHVSRETEDLLKRHLALLSRWNARINLVSPATLARAWDRHIRDSAQLWPQAPAAPRRWVDLGSGAGFPGLVIAAIAADISPRTEVVLIESDGRKAAFLLAVLAETGLPARVLTARAEDVAPLAADVVSARALAPLPQLLPLVARHLAPAGIALLPKGRQADAEIAAARRKWRFGRASFPSLTDREGHVLKLSGIARV
jgi:16S rRNA (guanine527-N7)-methyltransferase